MKIKISLLFVALFLTLPFIGQAQIFSEDIDSPLPVGTEEALGVDDEEFELIEAPMLFVTDISFNETGFSTGEEITGSFNILNQEKADRPYYAGLFYKLELLRLLDEEENAYDETNVVLADTKVFDREITSTSGETQRKTFTYQLPKNLVSGKYILAVELVNKAALTVAFDQSSAFDIAANNHFLDITDVTVLKDSDVFDAFVGPNFSKDEIPIIQLTVANVSNELIETTLTGFIRGRSEIGEIIKTFDGGKYVFQAQEQREIRVQLPQIDTPGSYLAFLRFFESNDSVSAEVSARFVIEGTSAHIIEILADKEEYQKGDVALITVSVIGSADTVAPEYVDGELFDVVKPDRLEDSLVDLNIKIFDGSNNKLVGSAGKEVNLTETDAPIDLFDIGSFEFTIEVPIAQYVKYYRIEALLTKDGRVLDAKTIINPALALGVPQNPYVNYVLGIGMLVLLVIASWLFMRKRNRGASTTNLGALVLLLVFAGSIFILTPETSYAGKRIFATWSKPYNGQEYTQDDIIEFSVLAQRKNSSNKVVLLSLVFYIDGKKVGEKSPFKLHRRNTKWISFKYPASRLSLGEHKVLVEVHLKTRLKEGDSKAKKRTMRFQPRRIYIKCSEKDQTAPYSVCENNQCVSVAGCGVSTCSDDTECALPLPQETLSVDLEAAITGTDWQQSLSGTDSLTGVDLRASVSGNAQGTINYKFDCTNDGTYEYVFDNISDNPKTVIDACDYPDIGDYTAKVFVERGTAPPETDTVSIKVTVPSCLGSETYPHSTCQDNQCTSVSACGVSDCSSNADCVSLPPPPPPECSLEGQTKPYSTCEGTTCIEITDQCGASSCSTDVDCEISPEFQEVMSPLQRFLALLKSWF